MLKVLGMVRFAAAAAIVVALTTLIVNGANNSPTFTYGNFFSFFTVESNIIAALVFLVAGFAALRGNQSPQLSGLRGAATTFMVITGVVYNIALADLQEALETNIAWANFIVHVLIPIVALLDFLVDRTVAKLGLRNALFWLIFPILWLIYTMIRGPIVDWYPYPFLDVDHQGQGVFRVILNCLMIAVAFVVVSIVVAYTTRVLNMSEPRKTPRAGATTPPASPTPPAFQP